MYLIFDTETTGLPKDWKAPVTQVDNWPRMVQLAWVRFDAKGELFDQGNHIIAPEGYTIPKAASDIHGITTAKAMAEGQSLLPVLEQFADLLAQSDCVVAHNISFDENILGAEFIRKGVRHQLHGKPKVCTMLGSTDYCRIPGQRGYKWPRLSELHYRLFKTYFEEAHNAAVDVQATARCFWELKRLGVL